MSSNKSTLSVSDCTSHDGRGGDILKMGYLKKLKVNFLFNYLLTSKCFCNSSIVMKYFLRKYNIT